MYNHFSITDKPKTDVTFTNNPVTVGKSVIIICESDGLPAPSHVITHNGTIISTGRTYTIPEVNWTHAGKYECRAMNNLAKHSDVKTLSIIGETIDCLLL